MPFLPGSGVDSVARLVGQRLSEVIGQNVVFDNRGGSGGIITAEIAARLKNQFRRFRVGGESH